VLKPWKIRKSFERSAASMQVNTFSPVLAEVAETRGKRSLDLERLKAKLIEKILQVIDVCIAQARVDVAEAALAKADSLNMKYGMEYNTFTVRIHEKRAMCLKYNRCIIKGLPVG
jgi:hypothetical protein